MTYRELKRELDEMADEDQDFSVTVYDPLLDEYHGVFPTLSYTDDSNDILDPGTPVLTIL